MSKKFKIKADLEPFIRETILTFIGKRYPTYADNIRRDGRPFAYNDGSPVQDLIKDAGIEGLFVEMPEFEFDLYEWIIVDGGLLKGKVVRTINRTAAFNTPIGERNGNQGAWKDNSDYGTFVFFHTLDDEVWGMDYTKVNFRNIGYQDLKERLIKQAGRRYDEGDLLDDGSNTFRFSKEAEFKFDRDKDQLLTPEGFKVYHGGSWSEKIETEDITLAAYVDDEMVNVFSNMTTDKVERAIERVITDQGYSQCLILHHQMVDQHPLRYQTLVSVEDDTQVAVELIKMDVTDGRQL